MCSANTSGFFSALIPTAEKTIIKHTIHCGNDSNNWLRAVAFSLCDDRKHFNSLNISLFSLQKHPERFPEVVQQLRQLTVDELLSHPNQYPFIFVKPVSADDIQTMRLSSYVLDQNAIGALANALNINITIQITRSGQSGQRSLAFQVNGAKNTLRIAQHNDHYFVRINHPFSIHRTALNLTSSVAYWNPKTAYSLFHEKTETSQDIVNRVNQAQKEFVSVVEEYIHILDHKLYKMFQAGELSPATLLDMYLACFKAQVENNQSPSYIGIHQGNHALLDQLMLSSPQSSVEPATLPKDVNRSLNTYLIEGIARAISLKQITIEEVFNCVEMSEPIEESLNKKL